ncbi:unnamed protein product, partial [Amoebophrya sp. A25]
DNCSIFTISTTNFRSTTVSCSSCSCNINYQPKWRSSDNHNSCTPCVNHWRHLE